MYIKNSVNYSHELFLALCQGRCEQASVALPCLNSRCDSTARGWQGDLLLYDGCREYRFPTAVSIAGANKPIAPATDVTYDCDVAIDCDIDNDAVQVDGFVRCELLYFVQNKCDVLTVDRLVAMRSNFYRSCEVDAARNQLETVSG